MVMNRDRAKREQNLSAAGHYRWLDAFLRQHNPGGTWLFDASGWPRPSSRRS
jgi:hypothetical protein